MAWRQGNLHYFSCLFSEKEEKRPWSVSHRTGQSLSLSFILVWAWQNCGILRRKRKASVFAMKRHHQLGGSGEKEKHEFSPLLSVVWKTWTFHKACKGKAVVSMPCLAWHLSFAAIHHMASCPVPLSSTQIHTKAKPTQLLRKKGGRRRRGEEWYSLLWRGDKSSVKKAWWWRVDTLQASLVNSEQDSCVIRKRRNNGWAVAAAFFLTACSSAKNNQRAVADNSSCLICL